MSQPIPRRVKEKKPELVEKQFNTLLVDGSNLFEVCWRADKTLSCEGRCIGGIFQFLLQMKILLKKGNFRYCFVFFDGENSGQKRYDLYPMYKMNREDKVFGDDNLSEYMVEFNAKVKSMQDYFLGKRKATKSETEKENFFWQRDVLIECLENLFCRVIVCDKTEADDFIGYYVTHKKKNERIVITSNDRDLTQLIEDDVIVYIQSMKDFVTKKNFFDKMGYHYENVVLKKVLCGDASDNIKGIKGFGEGTLYANYPDFKTKKMYLDEIIGRAAAINEERAKEKKKPLKWAENIVNRVTDGIHGNMVYEINERIINLREPLMTDEAVETIESFMYAPLDPDGRSFGNLYSVLCEAGVDELKDEGKFSSFFVEFKYLIQNEENDGK